MLLSNEIERMWDIIESDRPDREEFPFMVRMRNHEGPAIGFQCRTIEDAHRMLNDILHREQATGRRVGLA